MAVSAQGASRNTLTVRAGHLGSSFGNESTCLSAVRQLRAASEIRFFELSTMGRGYFCHHALKLDIAVVGNPQLKLYTGPSPGTYTLLSRRSGHWSPRPGGGRKRLHVASPCIRFLDAPVRRGRGTTDERVAEEASEDRGWF